jgi:hypothetical protein
MIFLLISGVLVFCTGLLAILFGIPIKEFSFGNTMILTGSIVACSGFIQIGLSFVVRELRQLARATDARVPETSDMAPARRSRDQRDVAKGGRPAGPRQDDMLFTRDVAPGMHNFDSDDASFGDEGRTPPAIAMPPLQSSPPMAETPFSDAWDDEPPLRPLPPPVPAGANPDRPRRDVAFTSRRRGQGDAQPSEPPMRADDVSDLDHKENEFQDAWQQSDRPRAPRDGQGAPLASPRPPPSRRSETPPVTVVKSGVVDTMAYSLYSDGSIEAQTPEGMVRFASIDQLRAHLDQRG